MKSIPFFQLFILFYINISKSFSQSPPQTIIQVLQNGTMIPWVYCGGDEFNGSELDLTLWDECFSHGCDYNSNSYFKTGVNHHVLNSGILNLPVFDNPGYYEVWNWDNNGNFFTTNEFRPFTSGMIKRKQKYKYGLFEISCQMPTGLGIWPAFWLYGGSPNQEIDIFEFKGEFPNMFHIDTHCPSGCGSNFGGWQITTGSLSNSYNNFMGEWGNDYCIWYFNYDDFAIWLGSFTEQLNLIANNAAAPNCPEAFCPGPNSTTNFPSNFYIDYIRIWTKLECDSTVNLNNYNQQISDPTIHTGNQINCTNLSLNNFQYLQLYAINQININQETFINGEFEANLVNCPIINDTSQKNRELFYFNQVNNDNRVLNIISETEKEKLSDNIFHFYPNPNRGEITINWSELIQNCNIAQIKIIDNHGHIVYSENDYIETNRVLNLNWLPNGVYMLSITTCDKSANKLIIISL